MKRHFVIIALCSIVLSLTSCIKPANESFVGTYKGTLITTYTINVQGNYETNVEDTDFTIAIAQGDKRDEVIATCSAYGQNFTLNGTVDDDHVMFDPCTINTSVSDLFENEIPILGSLTTQVDHTIEISGTLDEENNYLVIDGNVFGTITATILTQIAAFPYTGTVKGVLYR